MNAFIKSGDSTVRKKVTKTTLKNVMPMKAEPTSAILGEGRKLYKSPNILSSINQIENSWGPDTFCVQRKSVALSFILFTLAFIRATVLQSNYINFYK